MISKERIEEVRARFADAFRDIDEDALTSEAKLYEPLEEAAAIHREWFSEAEDTADGPYTYDLKSPAHCQACDHQAPFEDFWRAA